MEELTVKELYMHLHRLLKNLPELGDRKILISDDEEGNGFHGLYFGLSFDTQAFQDVLYDISEEELEQYVLLG